MPSPFNAWPNALRLFSLVFFMFVHLTGCTEPGSKNAKTKQEEGEEMIGLSEKLISLNSSNHFLVAADLDHFRPGRGKEEILKDVKWRGNFYMSADHSGKAVYSIVYELVSGDPNVELGISIWAIFIDGKFAKFVNEPPSLPEDKEVVKGRRTSWSRPKPLKVGDDRFLIRGMNAVAVSIDELKKEVKSTTAPPEQVDPGLTVAYLRLRAMGAAPEPEAPPSEKDYLRNAALRDQFNAARLNIGTTRSEVRATLKTEPLESGSVDAGEYEIYGSNESFDISTISGSFLHFTNILVVFQDGKAIAISSVPAGYDWRRRLSEATIDLPQRAPDDSSADAHTVDENH